MSSPSIAPKDSGTVKTFLSAASAASGFSRVRFLAPFVPASADEKRGRENGNYAEGAPSAIVAALPYGNAEEAEAGPSAGLQPDSPRTRLDAFSRRNYYAEAVARMQAIAAAARARFGGRRSDYRVFCNSPIPEKPIAEASGLGKLGRNTLIITPEAGSLVVIAAMTLPFRLEGDGPLPDEPDPCDGCAACVAACPTGALDSAFAAALGRDRLLDRNRCIQWYASRPGTIPPEIAAKWGDRLYGCSTCRDACPHNAGPIFGARTERGALPSSFDARALAEASDAEVAALFRGTALGMSWLGPQSIKRNARLAAGIPGVKS